jgi:hypothetical protein
VVFAVLGAGLAGKVAVVTDGQLSGLTNVGITLGEVAPEAAMGGTGRGWRRRFDRRPETFRQSRSFRRRTRAAACASIEVGVRRRERVAFDLSKS